MERAGEMETLMMSPKTSRRTRRVRGTRSVTRDTVIYQEQSGVSAAGLRQAWDAEPKLCKHAGFCCQSTGLLLVLVRYKGLLVLLSCTGSLRLTQVSASVLVKAPVGPELP